MEILDILTGELSLKKEQIEAAVKLLDEGNTVPFIARYRKEVTGSMDDEQLRTLTERLTYLRNLQKRRDEVLSLIGEQGKLTPEIEAAVAEAKTLTEIEDIYRPFRPKRKTRASIAREKGLEPLAALLLEQRKVYEPSIEESAAAYIDEEKGVASAEEALAGASDILAEDFSDNAAYRREIRALTVEYGQIRSQKNGDGNPTYEMYFDYSDKLKAVPSHRVLAMNRGEAEEHLKIRVEVDRDLILNALLAQIITDYKSPAFSYMAAAVCDAYDRLIAPSIEREIRADLTENAGENAIKLFSDNLRHLLMAAPLKGKTVLGYDPGYRTGCKLAVVDKTGMVIDTAVIYPTKPHEKIEQSKKIVKSLIARYGVDVIAIGNGTASGESEMFIAETLSEIGGDAKYIIVSEAGASVYSASKVGAEEFPDFDVTQRSAVSIARRLQDPLAELVKIDPKSIGVGQYQHDMKEARLDEALTGVVEDCVNAVGVDLNTASYMLLSYIAGINTIAAKNIVKYRDENGEFTSRAQVLKVPRIGAKAYEQCAGFLRVPGSKEILDNTGVHPESYEAARALLEKFGYGPADLRHGASGLRAKCVSCGMKKLAAELGIGEETLTDIVGELEKPGRDVRDALPPPQLREKVLTMEELTPGMILTGTVRNVIDFGAFVDIGVHQDGLVHISELSDRFVRHPREAVSVGDVVRVRVKNVDLQKKRIGLSMKNL
ncbi:MAG: RNA-binding transcriptional accessory protein [Clostridia bacterium]|nr:RNA-binding transcriptional accessory protein [Clostridia bacterium]